MSDDLKAKIQSRFTASADSYVTSDVHARGESLGVLFDLVGPQSDWAMLDVATGAGHTALTFAPHVASVIATDLTHRMLTKAVEAAAAKDLNGVHAGVADAELLPFDDHSFDLLTCRLAFHHFSDPEQALREFRRVLSPAGVLGFTDNITVEETEAANYYNDYERLRDPSHNCVYSLSKLEEMLVTCGFRSEATRRLSKEFEFENWANRQRVSTDDRKRLLGMMRELPDALTPLLLPRWADGTMYFTLQEAVILARPA